MKDVLEEEHKGKYDGQCNQHKHNFNGLALVTVTHLPQYICNITYNFLGNKKNQMQKIRKFIELILGSSRQNKVDV